ncbi:protein obstructor-E-like [Uranotaenia lowii]|uniref:protein obstructor-E-like n=1 Tax=Uranotaenia lowii TaxID=190385 RepID=UPI002479E54B|nr:protein obstructor-E-like [Uranotaenia lowii]
MKFILLLALGAFGVFETVATENPCEGVLMGIVLHPEFCWKYFVCFKEEAEEQTCPDGEIFSYEEVGCVPGNRNTCVEGEPEPEPEPSENPCGGIWLGNVANPDDCTKFTRCVLGRPSVEKCREGWVFSRTLFFCVPGAPNSCDVWAPPVTSTPAPGEIQPIPMDFCINQNKAIGRLAHPQFCTRYVNCFLFTPSDHSCPPWMVFDAKRMICLPGNPNTCDTILGPGASTTTASPPITDEVCEETSVGVIPHPYSCYKYLICFRGRVSENECPSYHVFSEKYNICLPGNRYDCTIYGADD